MTDRHDRASLRDLVRDAVRSQRLDEDARDIARLLSVQFRERARQAQEAAQTAGSVAAHATTGTALPAARRATEAAGRRAEPVVRQASAGAVGAARSLAGSRAGRAAAVGATAGAVASVIMGGAMLAARRAGIMGETPPKQITDKGSKKAARAAKKATKRSRKGRENDHDHHPAAGAASDSSERDDGAHPVESTADSVEQAPPGTIALASSIAHVGFGMALGAGFAVAYSALPRSMREPLPTLGESLIFATAVWATSYAGWVPALGLMPPPSEDDPGRQATLIASHLVFGAVLGAGLVAGLDRE